jgi:hypothetical protein
MVDLVVTYGMRYILSEIMVFVSPTAVLHVLQHHMACYGLDVALCGKKGSSAVLGLVRWPGASHQLGSWFEWCEFC